MEHTERLERTYTQVQQLIDGVTPDQMGAPTPCTEWDVRALLNHMMGTVIVFGGGSAEGDVVGDDPSSVFRQATKTNLEAWRQPGAMERTMTLPFGDVPGSVAMSINMMDSYVHGLDLAVATGQEERVDPGLAETMLSMAKEMGLDNFRRPGVFGPEVPCEDPAAAHRRLLAFLGREV